MRKTFFRWKKDEFKELGSGLLTSTTAEAYSHDASSTLKTFIYHNRLEILQEWLALWNDRKSLIFCAFTNIQHSCQMVIQGPIRYIFTWSSFFFMLEVLNHLTNAHFEEPWSGTYDSGYGPPAPKMNIHAEQREKQLRSQIGSDLTHFNIYRKGITTKTYTIGEESYYNPPKRKISNIKLFENRLRKSRQLSDLMKIGSFKKNNTTNLSNY